MSPKKGSEVDGAVVDRDQERLIREDKIVSSLRERWRQQVPEVGPFDVDHVNVSRR